jgi:hypothetical protein
MAERNLSIRLSVVDGGKVKAELSEGRPGIMKNSPKVAYSFELNSES